MDTGLGGALPYEFELVYSHAVSLPKNKRKHVMEAALKDFLRMTEAKPWVVKDEGLMRLLKEWAVFDWPFYRRNYTMMEEFLDFPPEGVNQETMDVIAQAYETSMVGEFLVEGAFPEEAAIVLRDIAANTAYVVRDGGLSAQLAQQPVAMLGARLIRVGEDWLMPTGPVFMLAGEFGEEQRRAMIDAAEPVDFCDLVRSAYGYLEAMGSVEA